MSRALRLLVLGSLFVGAASGCRAGNPPSHGAAPEQITPGVRLCIAGGPVVARDGIFYPVGHPRTPTRLGPSDRCFVSEVAAARSGLLAAPIPPGDARIAGVYLVRPDSSVRRGCRRAAAALPFPVPCPGLLPRAPTDSQICTPCLHDRVFILETWFEGPPGYLGDQPLLGDATGHLVLLAAPDRTDRSYSWPPQIKADATVVGGRRAAWVTFPAGSELNSGHVALAWRVGGVVYGVSIHGRTSANRRIAKTVAAQIVLMP